MNKKIKTLAFALAASIGAFSLANAQVIFSETFESYGENVSLHGLNPDDGNPSNWVLQNANVNQGADAIAGASTDGMGANLRVGSYFRNATAEGSLPTMRRSFEAQENRIVEVSFKIRIDNASAGTHQVIIGGISTGSTVVASRFRFSPSSFAVYGKADQAGGTNGPVSTFVSDVIVGNWYQVTVHLDSIAQTFWTSATNLDDDSEGQSGVSDTFYFWNDSHTLDRFSIEQASTSQIGASFDDIVITSAIPEPSTYAALFGLATLAFVFLRRRRK